MDIHRSRFVPYPSSAINALAFSHTEPDHGHQDPESLRLAIGRANGNIEIWNPKHGAWLQEKVFYGGKDRSVEGLAWTQEPDQKNAHGKLIPGRLRLFSIGYSSSVTEWDLATGLPARHSNGNHSEVWCFAAQPRQKTTGPGSVEGGSAYQKLVAGCADGTIVLLSTEDDDLTFHRFVSRATNKKARALSIVFKDRDTVLAGFADSIIRVFDTRNGNVIRNISLGSGPHGGPREILVWKVKCLSNGDFVSGDSTGEASPMYESYEIPGLTSRLPVCRSGFTAARTTVRRRESLATKRTFLILRYHATARASSAQAWTAAHASTPAGSQQPN
jgi:U3 small nucleolar RNA-associated protein 4